ncbi:MAG: glycosyltransferase family 2 protein [bacterium]
MQPKVYIIILNWNGWQDTIECLKSIEKNNCPNYQVVVVDNGSTNESVAKIKRHCERAEGERGNLVEIIENKENLGFSGGNNVGMKYALEKGADYVLLLNNDTVVDKSFLSALIAVGEKNSKAGLLGSKIYFYNSPIVSSVIMSESEESRSSKNIIWFAGGNINYFSGKGFHIGLNKIDKGQYDQVKKVDYITGCCLLIKKELIDKIGFLDEDYFLYYEDTDYSWRAKKEGYDRLLVPQSKIWHKCSMGTQEGSPSYIYYHARNRLLMIWKNGSTFVKMYIHGLVFWKVIKQIFKAIFIKEKRIWAKNIVLGVKDFYLGRTGPFVIARSDRRERRGNPVEKAK